ncbi:glycosyltransferase family 2 protein [Pelagicoccus sp. SDUM812005]|uniref:glycosyltransferase family 2 protein n=1 Tax=Pelagicoccus sp. SDUM812005 TaxID=3041257 RepID=UPI00280DD656|nr:glycosyltransferase family 2 protein [Pelagicoccus sp. SDUM812005]MDQ8180940.1 glycosyltransferase family 2 protein [Pelagicoccus sp. SDUM812005]
MKLGIGICNYNRSADVTLAVEAALQQTLRPDLVLVLDNASTDDSVDELRSRFGSQIEILQNQTNTGGAGGFSRLSQELLQRGFDYIALLDSDAFLRPNCLEQMRRALNSYPEAGICGARIMHADQPELIQECGAFLDWDTASFRLNRGDQPFSSELPLVDFVDYVPACALLARRETFQNVGHFDPSFFIYFDDIEWCQRARKQGYMTLVANQASALHKGGGKTKTNHFPTYYFWRNRIRFFLGNASNQAAINEFLLQNATQAIATSQTLGLSNSAAIIREALFDALAQRYGKKDFEGIALELDPPSPLLLPAEYKAKTEAVEHIFAPTHAHDEIALQDPYCKRLLAKQSRKFAPVFQKHLNNVRNELASKFA